MSGAFQTINQVGQSMSMIQAIFATICCLGGALVAGLLIFSKSSLVTTRAQITSTECRSVVTKDGTRMSCTSQVKYTFGGTEYTGTLIEDSLNAARYSNQMIDILVDSKAPQQIHPHRPSNRAIGFVLSAVCSCIFTFAWGQYLLTKKIPGAGAGMLAYQAFN